MKSIVITGSTRGIGYGLADVFLAKGCMVTVNGRSPSGVVQAVTTLSQTHDEDQIAGQAAVVADVAQVEALWETAVSRFGKVDIWINNAGLGHNLVKAWQLPTDRIQAIVETNVTGVIIGSHVAMRKMQAQGHGHLYNMQGAGANGKIREGMSVYGTTKAGVNAFTRALIKEAAGTAVKVSAISPGMVITDMLMDPVEANPEHKESTIRIFNILADKVETVTPWLAEKMLNNDKHGQNIRWLTTPKIIWRFATARFTNRNLFTD